mmetsp:Transcript_26585/g.51494  ORF Transcript_26585/g.51494 Transcript_26585/m.51494 type:complete len:307 (-) Transcript_26585:216-1136(-)
MPIGLVQSNSSSMRRPPSEVPRADPNPLSMAPLVTLSDFLSSTGGPTGSRTISNGTRQAADRKSSFQVSGATRCPAMRSSRSPTRTPQRAASPSTYRTYTAPCLPAHVIPKGTTHTVTVLRRGDRAPSPTPCPTGAGPCGGFKMTMGKGGSAAWYTVFQDVGSTGIPAIDNTRSPGRTPARFASPFTLTTITVPSCRCMPNGFSTHMISCRRDDVDSRPPNPIPPPLRLSRGRVGVRLGLRGNFGFFCSEYSTRSCFPGYAPRGSASCIVLPSGVLMLILSPGCAPSGTTKRRYRFCPVSELFSLL